MKQDELKKVLKPLIKQCIKEVIFEEGVLSGLISEVVQGLGGQQTIVESASPPQQDFSRQQVELQEEARAGMEDKRRKLEESLGLGAVFENTAPLSRGGSVGDSPSQSPLSNYAPNDPGVDISGIMALGAGSNWKKMI
jgi:hypothetical protein